MFCNSNDENDIAHLCLMENKGVGNQDTSNNDDEEDACT